MKRPPATGAFFTGAAFTGTTIMQHSSARPNSNALFSRASLFYLAVLIVGALECCVRVESIRAGRADHVPLITRMKEC